MWHTKITHASLLLVTVISDSNFRLVLVHFVTSVLLGVINPFLPGKLLKGLRQTVLIQIRCQILWHLFRVYICC